jgi:hypothetical protein
MAIAGEAVSSWRVAREEDEYMSLICGGPESWDTWELATVSLVGVANGGGHWYWVWLTGFVGMSPNINSGRDDVYSWPVGGCVEGDPPEKLTRVAPDDVPGTEDGYWLMKLSAIGYRER